MRPDAKSPVSVAHKAGRPVRITFIVISHQTDDLSQERICKDLIKVSRGLLDSTGLLDKEAEFYINPTGKFVIGGSHGDAGLAENARSRWPMPLGWPSP